MRNCDEQETVFLALILCYIKKKNRDMPSLRDTFWSELKRMDAGLLDKSGSIKIKMYRSNVLQDEERARGKMPINRSILCD